jgi:methylated-DNA-protein-cysteine methyltransferase-like protein
MRHQQGDSLAPAPASPAGACPSMAPLSARALPGMSEVRTFRTGLAPRRRGPHAPGLVPRPPGGHRPDDLRRQRILATVDSIPAGRVASYGQVAEEAHLPRRARLVGRLLASLPPGSSLPWHRVVDHRGAIAERGDQRGERRQRERLEREGVHFLPDGRVDLARHRWRP